MARPIKQGLDYFPTDTTFWHSLKVRRLRQYCGSQAPHVLLVMLGLTYQEEGYFLEWNEEVCFLVAESAGTPEEFVTEVLEKALTLGFFHREIFEHYQILTSEEIQSRYIMATKKRKEVKLEAKYLLKLPAQRHNLLILPDTQVSPTLATSSEKEEPQPAVSPVVHCEEAAFASSPLPTTTKEAATDLVEHAEKPIEAPISEAPTVNESPILQKTTTFKTWQQLWQAPNTLLQAQISRLLQKYGDELVTAAIQIAGNKSVPKQSGLSFVKSCLKKWQENGVTTLAEVHIFQEKGARLHNQEHTFNSSFSPSPQSSPQRYPARNRPYRQEKLIDWETFANPPVTRQAWLKLQKELRQFMGEEYTMDATFQATAAEQRWIFDESRDYQDEVYLAATEKED